MRHRNSLVAVLAASVFAASLQHAAYAGVISTQQYLTTIDERMAALTDQELQLLATDLENMPAGGSLLGALGVAFIVLLILELVGVIDIFNKI